MGLLLCLLVIGTMVMTSHGDLMSTKKDALKCSQSSLWSCNCRNKNVVLCDKADCMNKLPMSSLSTADRKKITTLKVTKQKTLTEIDDEDLRGLKNLVTAKLSKNGILTISQHAFDDLESLERLDLHGNKLTEVPEAIQRIPKLRQLNLVANRIAMINMNDFSRNQDLEFLILRNNIIENFPQKLPQSLRKLSLARNRLRSVGDIRYLENLSMLRLDGNMFTEIPRTLIPDSIEELTMCSNKLNDDSVMDSSTLESYPMLRRLRLTGNTGITNIGSKFFSKAQSLREVDLSFCGIKKIASDAFACARDLQNLGLQGNKLSSFDESWFMYNRRLRSLTMANNPWECTCDFVSYLMGVEKAVMARCERLIRKHETSKDAESMEIVKNAKFNNDFSKLECDSVEDELKAEVDAESNNFTSYQDAKCAKGVKSWKFVAMPLEMCPKRDVDEESDYTTMKPTRKYRTTTASEPTTRISRKKNRRTTTTTEPATTTTDGAPCSWPFTEGGVEYKSQECVLKSSWTTTYTWCWTDSIKSEWDYCTDEECP